MAARTSAELRAIIDAILRGALTKRQARRLSHEDSEVVVLALLAASKRIAEQEARIGKQDARIAEQDARLAGRAGFGL